MKTLPCLALGPVLYFWDRERMFGFYREIAQSAVKIVYLGETVCSRRRQLRRDDWLELAEMLRQAGKEVVLSSLTLLEADSELAALRSLCQSTEHAYAIEANDMAAVNLLAGKQRKFIGGPALNIYNPRTLALLADAGMQRWSLPLELGRENLAAIQAERPEGMETEVFVFGRLPLAWSARCFTARAANLPKDDCHFRCLDHPDGLMLRTRDYEPFLVLNGIQTQSVLTQNLIRELPVLLDLGVDVLRISPQSRHTPEIISLFHACLHAEIDEEKAAARLRPLLISGECDGYWHQQAGMTHQDTGCRHAGGCASADPVREPA